MIERYFPITSIVKPIWGLISPEVICPEYACSKLIQLEHVTHLRCDNIIIIYIFKSLDYVMSPTAITYRIYETFFLFDSTQFNQFFKITKLNSKDQPA